MAPQQQSVDAPLLVMGDDGSTPSDTAWEWINAHRWPGWRMEVCTAVDDEEEIEWGRPARTTEWSPPWKRELSAETGAAGATYVSMATDPRAMLADRTDADLMVVGLRRTGHLEALLSGSTTEWLLHHPPTPLAMVRTAAPSRRASICVDGSDHALRALRAFGSLPLSGGAEVSLVTVDDGRADTETAVHSAMLELAALGLGATPVVLAGKPTDAILAHLEERRPDLVVLGTRGLTGWMRLRLGSTAAAVVRAAPCTSLVACEARPG